MGARRNRDWVESAATGALYLAAALPSLLFTRYDEGFASLWVAGAVLLARLGATPRRSWGPTLVVCGAVHFAATASFGVDVGAVLVLSLIAMAESVVAALLLRRMGSSDDGVDALARLGVMVLAAGVVAPGAAAFPAAAVFSAATGTAFATNWTTWYFAHALGTLTFLPVLTLVFTGEARRWLAAASPALRGEFALLLLLVAATALLVFSDPARSLLFLPVLPVMLTTFRVGRLGAAASVVVIALIGGWFTFSGLGPFADAAIEPVGRVRLFQLFLAATVLTALPAAAELRRQRAVFDRLRDSEARYRLLADNSSDIVLSTSLDGVIGYASPSATRLGGYSPDELVGRRALELVLAEDRGAVARAFRQVTDGPDEVVSAEYRIPTAWGEQRWFESMSRAVRDDDGAVVGAVSAIRDVSHRKALEAELARAAATDPLTGLPNRRAFDAALERLVRGGGQGCLAVFDIDHFKAVNDRFGHDGGDRVLVAFAAAARAAVREGDLVARLGGEEFGVLLPGASPEQARAVCERLRTAAAETPVLLDGGLARITVSAGLARAAADTGAAELMRAADEALYRAKTAGRDRLDLAA